MVKTGNNVNEAIASDQIHEAVYLLKTQRGQ